MYILKVSLISLRLSYILLVTDFISLVFNTKMLKKIYLYISKRDQMLYTIERILWKW